MSPMYHEDEEKRKTLRKQFLSVLPHQKMNIYLKQAATTCNLKKQIINILHLTHVYHLGQACQYVRGYSELNQKLKIFMIETHMLFNQIYQAFTELSSQKENRRKKRIEYWMKYE